MRQSSKTVAGGSFASFRRSVMFFEVNVLMRQSKVNFVNVLGLFVIGVP